MSRAVFAGVEMMTLTTGCDVAGLTRKVVAYSTTNAVTIVHFLTKFTVSATFGIIVHRSSFLFSGCLCRKLSAFCMVFIVSNLGGFVNSLYMKKIRRLKAKRLLLEKVLILSEKFIIDSCVLQIPPWTHLGGNRIQIVNYGPLHCQKKRGMRG